MGGKANPARLERTVTRFSYLYACGLILRSIRQTVPAPFRYAYWLYFITKSDRLWRRIEATQDAKRAAEGEDSTGRKDGLSAVA